MHINLLHALHRTPPDVFGPPMTLQLDVAGRLAPGDVLCYRPSSLFGWAIRIKTGGPQSHAELYVGNQLSIASRDRVGTGLYPLRLPQLGWVLRPIGQFNVQSCMSWFIREGKNQKYGLLDLITFFGFPVNAPGVVCSPFVVYALRAGGIPAFGTTPPERIAPNDLVLSELLSDVSALVLMGDLTRPVRKPVTSLSGNVVASPGI